MLDWRIVPCRARTKIPLISGWPHQASSRLGRIRNWEFRYPGCNWGVATGPDSGILVLDIDGEVGRRSLATLEAKHNETLPETLVSISGRKDGGQHHWFLYPEGESIRNSNGKLGPGLDVRATGGLVIIPLSTHPSGAPYQWSRRVSSITELPPWLLVELRDSSTRPASAPRAQSSLLPEGFRNDGLFRYGAALRRRGYNIEQIETELLEANERRCKPPLAEEEIRKIAHSVARYSPGGPDPLELAWSHIEDSDHSSSRERFHQLCCELQRLRSGMPIALPLKRISGLLGIDWSRVGQIRREAVAAGLLEPVAHPVARKLAATFRCLPREP